MKIRVEVTLDIDAVAWEQEYGISGADAIRADVKEHARQTLLEHYTDLRVLRERQTA